MRISQRTIPSVGTSISRPPALHSAVYAISFLLLLLAMSGGKAEAANFALSFSGGTMSPQIGVAALVTTATDDLWMDVWLQWAGPATTISSVQTPVYNGNSGCSGWGITLLDATGQVGILAGGVAVVVAPVFLTPGQWQHVRAARLGGVFELSVDDVVYPLSGNPTPNSLGTCRPEVTSIGSGTSVTRSTDPYNGVIDKVRINVIGATFQDGLTFWKLDEGSGTTATDIHGTIMRLIGNPAWVAGASKP